MFCRFVCVCSLAAFAAAGESPEALQGRDAVEALKHGGAYAGLRNAYEAAGNSVVRNGPLGLAPVYVQEAKLAAPDDGPSTDGFGWALALSGDTALVGAPQAYPNGAAYVFVRSGTTWTPQAKITIPEGVQFGAGVSLSGNTALIEDHSLSRVYVFVRSGTTWTQQATLLPPDAPGGYCRKALSLSGDMALIGNGCVDSGRGATYVFVRSGTTWTQEAKLTASDGATDDGFGTAVSLNAGSALIGAAWDDSGRGSVYVFVRSGTSWSQQVKLLASDSQAGQYFGMCVSLSGDTAIAGVLNGAAAYVFVRSGIAWTQQQKLQVSGVPYSRFGSSVSVSGDTAVAGDGRAGPNGGGGAYVFSRTGTTWTEQALLTGRDTTWSDDAGSPVAQSGDTILMGSGWPDAAYVFRAIDVPVSSRSRPAVFRNGFFWIQDVNGNYAFDGTGPGQDRAFAFGGVAGDVPVTGDWNGDGKTKVGVFRQGFYWILDRNGNGIFEPAIDAAFAFGGVPGDVPVTGDWNGDGKTEVGIFRQGFYWMLDVNGNGTFDYIGPGGDIGIAFGGVPGDVPVTGDWNGDGRTKIGIFRQGFFWILDANGNFAFDGTAAGQDLAFAFGGIAGDVPVTGNWNGVGGTKVGVFRQGFFWVLDQNGDGLFTSTPADLAFAFGGITGDRPVAGRW